MKQDTQTASTEDKKSWLKRLGWAGFLFFLIKGLVWLVITYLIIR
jgi:hypothetical protein